MSAEYLRSIVSYEYFCAAGTLEDLKKATGDLAGAVLEEPSGKPKVTLEGIRLRAKSKGSDQFIAVYQRRILLSESRNVAVKIDESTLRNAKDTLSEMIGINELIVPSLIHIGYNPEKFSRKKVIELVSDPTGRIAISEIEKLPGFREKPTQDYEDFMSSVAVEHQREIDARGFPLIANVKVLPFKVYLSEILKHEDKAKKALESLIKFGMTTAEFVHLKQPEWLRTLSGAINN